MESTTYVQEVSNLCGQLQKAMAGRVRWLDAGGREMLSRKAKQRHARAEFVNDFETPGDFSLVRAAVAFC